MSEETSTPNLPRYDYLALPQRLKERSRFCLAAVRQGDDGKFIKTHLRATETCLGCKASFLQEGHLVPFERAQEALNRLRGEPAPGGALYSGLALALMKGDGLVVVDLDGAVARTPEGRLEVKAEAATIVRRLGGVAELSSSKTGLHVFVEGNVEKSLKRDTIEVYSDRHFFCLTGLFGAVAEEEGRFFFQPLPAGEVPPVPGGEIVQEVLDELCGKEGADDDVLALGEPSTEKVAKVLEKRFPQKFPKLYEEGSIECYESPSEARQALALMAAWYAGAMEDPAEKVDGLVREIGAAFFRNYPEEEAKWGRRKEEETARALKELDGHFYCPRGLAKADRRRVVVCEPGREDLITRDLCDALKDTYFIRNSRLVTVAKRLSYANELGREEETPIIEEVTKEINRGVLLEKVCFKKIHSKTHELTPCPIPVSVEDGILGARAFWKFPLLRAISQVPFMRHDGSVACQEGYDPKSCTFICFKGQSYPEIPARPTQEEMEAAKNFVLTELLAEFPFRTAMDTSVAVAAFLTIFVRATMTNAPLFGISGAGAGTGKSTLCNMLSLTASCGAPVATSLPTDPVEEAKTLQTLLLQGSPIILLDNLEKPIGSATLNSILTSPCVSFRRLGAHEEVVQDCSNVTLICNGNNLTFKGDVTRRSLLCYLDARTSNPAGRHFTRQDPERWVAENRGRIAQALLTLLVWQRQHDEGAELPPMGSFEAWSDAVRRTCVYTMNLPDPIQIQKELRSENPENEELCDVLRAWEAEFGFDSRASSKTVMDNFDGAAGSDTRGRVHEAIHSLYGKEKELSKRGVTRWLTRNAGLRVEVEEGDLYLEKVSKGREGKYNETFYVLRCEANADATPADKEAGALEAVDLDSLC